MILSNYTFLFENDGEYYAFESILGDRLSKLRPPACQAEDASRDNRRGVRPGAIRRAQETSIPLYKPPGRVSYLQGNDNESTPTILVDAPDHSSYDGLLFQLFLLFRTR